MSDAAGLLVRVGFIARGLTYGLIAAIAAGLFAYALWKLALAVLGTVRVLIGSAGNQTREQRHAAAGGRLQALERLGSRRGVGRGPPTPR